MRRFDQHLRRPSVCLDGYWDFTFLGDRDVDDVDVAALSFADRMPVPGCFDATPRYGGKRGLTAYRRQLTVTDTARHRLVFHSVHHWCRVFVDGQQIAEHCWGYTRFHADFSPRQAGSVELVVLVDNRFDFPRVAIHFGAYDWYQYGGISRSVELQRLGDLWLEGLGIETTDHVRRRLRVTLSVHSDRERRETCKLTCADRTVLEETVALAAGETVITRDLELAGAALWSPDEPALHIMRAEMGEDDLADRFGIRQVAAVGREIQINGEAVRLLGICRHETHPQFGAAIPEALHISDLQQIMDLGCNYIRAGHYTNNPAFLDLCDEMGMLVWAEANSWGMRTQELASEPILDAICGNIREMVTDQRNHPCIIIWGLLNECACNKPESRPAYERLIGQYRALDRSRLVAFPTKHILEPDYCMDLADLVAVNHYPGWYRTGIDRIGKEFDDIYAWLDDLGYGDRPVLHSEIGAGALYGTHDPLAPRWSEEYQANLLETVIRELLINRDRAAGLSIWQYCDGRTSTSAPNIAVNRPRGFNNKGIVDEYRRPKLAYARVQAMLRQLQSDSATTDHAH